MNRLSVARRIVKTACPVLGAIAALTVMVNWVAGITWASDATIGSSITDTDLSPGQSSSSVSTAGEYPDKLDIVTRVNGRNMSGRELDAAIQMQRHDLDLAFALPDAGPRQRTPRRMVPEQNGVN